MPESTSSSLSEPGQTLVTAVALRGAIHDLRSPLQSMFASIEALDGSALNQGQQDALARVRRAALAIDARAGDVATLLLIQQQGLSVHPTAFNPSEMLESVRESLAIGSTDYRGVTVRRPQARIDVVADPALFRQAFALLIRLLVKRSINGEVDLLVNESTGAGSVEIHASCPPSGVELTAIPVAFQPVVLMFGANNAKMRLAASDSAVSYVVSFAFEPTGQEAPVSLPVLLGTTERRRG